MVTDPQTHTPETNPQIGPITITLRRSVIRMALDGTHTSAKSPSIPFNSALIQSFPVQDQTRSHLTIIPQNDVENVTMICPPPH